ncbi:MAG TPA: DUF4242 domain-containing protein [Terracidiphilus sp.]|nr:DUF4242 domain-containing protein [Terracidiphilus sp.]
MPKYVIERDIPGAGELTPDQLQSISQTSCSALRKLGFDIQWEQSFVTGNRVYCIYRAPSEVLIEEHARLGGFPANRISLVSAVIDPTTAEHSQTHGRTAPAASGSQTRETCSA